MSNLKVDLFGNVIVDEPEVEVKLKKPSPFEYVKEFGDKRRLPGMDGYNAWLINNALSMRKDLVHFANEMNRYHHLPDTVQREFYYHAIKKGTYHAKYAKATKDEQLPIIARYFNCSMGRAKDYARVLTDEQCRTIVETVEAERGGRTQK